MVQSKQKHYKELMISVMDRVVRFLHEFGYSDADETNIFTSPIYATILYRQIKELELKVVDRDYKMVLLFLKTKIQCEI